MRRQTARTRENMERKEIERVNRNRAAEMLKSSDEPNLSEISRETTVDRRTLRRIRDAMKSNDGESLHRLLSPGEFQPGRPRVLSKSEERMLVSRLLYASKRGFGLDVDQVRGAMSEIANDGRRGYQNVLPSMATVRTFRAKHRELTLRTSQHKELAKVLAENPEHAKTLKAALEDVQSEFPTIFDNPDGVWNMDETAIDGRGNTKKIFCSSSGSNTGSKVDGDLSNGRHVTCVVTTSASGKKIPPFFIIEGCNIMKKFFEHLPTPLESNSIPKGFEKFFQTDWCDEDIGFAMSEKGSMEKEVLVAYIDHFNKHVRKIIPPQKQALLILDGHKSRVGLTWIKYGTERNICIVQGAANTTHYLQPADQYINRVLQRESRLFHDVLSAYVVTTSSVMFKIMKATYGYAKIEENDVRKSWDKCGLYPMDFRFVEIAELMWSGRDERVTEETVGYIDLTVSQRESDGSIVNRIQNIIESQNMANAEKVQKISMLTANAVSANNILQNAGAVHRPQYQSTSPSNVGPNFGVSPRAVKAGQAAVYLSKKEAVEAMETKEKEMIEEQKRKDERKRVALERKTAREAKKKAAQEERAAKRARQEVGVKNK